MKKHYQYNYAFLKSLAAFVILMLSHIGISIAQSDCYDIDFESGNLSGWTTSGNVVLVSSGTDVYGGFPVSAPGGNYSVKVGNNSSNTTSTISKSFTVTAANPIITYKYAMDLLNYPHSSSDAGRINIDILDNSNNPISCAHYEAFYSTNGGGTTGFSLSSQPPEGNSGGECCYGISYKPWTSLSIDLTSYIGQTVTLKASCKWCIYHVDWSYAYFDFGCTNVNIVQDTSCSRIGAMLIGPADFDTYNWTGPGVVAGQDNDTAYVNQTGLYTLTLTTATGCTITKTYNVTYVPPIATASISGNNSLCLGDSVTLTASGGVSYSWWGTSNGTPTLIASPAGVTTYTVQVTDFRGCTDTATTTLVIDPKPLAAFNFDDVCKGQNVNYTDNSNVTTGQVTGWLWNYGDNSSTGTTQNPNHLYTSAGTYPTTLIAITDKGCKDTLTQNVVIHPLPIAAFSSTNVCYGAIAFLNNASTISSPDIVQNWEWDFGDTSPLKNNENTSHLYGSPGTYNVELLTISNFGCRDSITRPFTVNPLPSVDFSTPVTSGCSPLCVTFANNSSIGNNGQIASCNWMFGDGNTSTVLDNSHNCYINNTGNTNNPLQKLFTVSLTVTSDSGCVNELTKTDYITVNPIPVADFDVDPSSISVLTPEIDIVNHSAGANSWNWNFGDSSTFSGETPHTHTYQDTGQYQITLIVQNQYLCKDTTYRMVRIEPDWAFYVPNSFTPNGDGINDTFQGYGYGLLKYHMLIFDRWGNKIFETRRYDAPWDGRANGGTNIAQQDVYIYQIIIDDIHSKNHTYMGTVTLVK